MFRTSAQIQFCDIIEAHIRVPDAPLLIEGATGLGKTRAYLKALFSSRKRVAVVLPTHQLIDQLLESKDMAAVMADMPLTVSAFRPRRHFIVDTLAFEAAAYESNRQSALQSDVLICTSASVILDQRLGGDYNGVTNRDVILFDEADQTPGLAALQSDMEITKRELSELAIKGKTPEQTVSDILLKKAVPSEIRAKAMLIREALRTDIVWFRSVGMTDEGGVALYHRLPGRLLKKISNRPTTIFVSATLSIGGKFDDFRRSMGIGEISALSRIIEPKNHGKLIFDFHLQYPVDSPQWLALVIEQIQQSTEEGPVLCVTGSHKLARAIGDCLPNATVRSPDETTGEAATRMGKGRILVAAGAWAGLDTPITWKTVIVPRIPFLGPRSLSDEWSEEDSDRHIIAEPMTSYLDSRNIAIRRMKQVMGRGLRSPDATCAIVICDDRVSQLGEIAPDRFKKYWFEGRRIEVTMSTSERNPALRLDALRHFGTICQACGHDPLILREIEVHHLHPLADRGPGLTTISDVAVLCRICHARAHKDGNNVISVQKLQEVARAETRAEKRRIINMD